MIRRHFIASACFIGGAALGLTASGFVARSVSTLPAAPAHEHSEPDPRPAHTNEGPCSPDSLGIEAVRAESVGPSPHLSTRSRVQA